MAKTKRSSHSTEPAEKPVETKEQKLIRLANYRVTKACKYINYIGNLAAYKPTESQIDKMVEALGQSCARVEARLKGTRSESISFQIS